MSKPGCGVRPTAMMLRVYLVKAPLVLAGLLVLGWAGACSDGTGPEPSPLPPQGVVVSDPTGAPAAGLQGAARLSAGAAESVNLAYASLLAGTAPEGFIASVRSLAAGSLVWTTVRNGGFDPVAVTAAVGDTIEVQVRDLSGAVVHEARVVVAAIRAPIVTRTYPPRRKRDVPLNSAMVLVFSEPVDEATLTPSSVRLFRGTIPVPVAGTVRLLQGSGTAVAFTSTAPLDRNRDYRLVVTRAVRDLDGDALEAGVTVAFTTGQSSTGPAASLTVSPDTVYMAAATYQMTATVRDEAGNELIDQPVTWSTSDPTGLTVSPTGLVTALAEGVYYVTARVGSLAASGFVLVLAGPPASVAISPSQGTVGAGGDTIVLQATVRDATGRLIYLPSVTWTSNAPEVATVAASGHGAPGVTVEPGVALGTVTGVSPGSVTITATSGTASGMVAVTVISPLPVASVVVTPESATLVVRATRQLRATVRGPNGKVLAGRPVIWTTDNAPVATVDTNGLVTGVAEGSAAVIATSEGVSDTAAISVTVLSFVSVSSGSEHTCGLTPNGAAYCWGNNGAGQLGDGSTTSSLVPVAVTGGLTFSALSAGGFYHTCGLTTTGAAYCWGENSGGQLGNGSTSNSAVPMSVTGGFTFSAVTVGSWFTCGLTTNGAVYCWGYNDDGQLGNGSTSPNSVPVPVTGGLTFSAVSAGGRHTCGVTTSGAAYCWGGEAGAGTLGNGSTSSSLVPVAVAGGLTFSAVSTGYAHSCGLTTGGPAYCWGNNIVGELGDGTTTHRLTPVAVTGGLTFSTVSAGGFHTCGLTISGAVYCWGINDSGQLGNGAGSPQCLPSGLPCSTSPVAVAGELTFASLSAGNGHSCAVTVASVAYSWGQNYVGQLGDGSTTARFVPVKVAGQP